MLPLKKLSSQYVKLAETAYFFLKYIYSPQGLKKKFVTLNQDNYRTINSFWMKVFLEKQFIKWWWLTMFILAIIVIIFGTSFYATQNSDENTTLVVSIICCLIAFPLVFGLLFLGLETRIDEKGIFTYFRPFGFTKRFFSWEEIDQCYVRQYSPISEYGGWGLRWMGSKSMAYNIWGNKGIQIVTHDGRRFLIGTQKPKDAQQIIDTHKTRNAHEI